MLDPLCCPKCYSTKIYPSIRLSIDVRVCENCNNAFWVGEGIRQSVIKTIAVTPTDHWNKYPIIHESNQE